MAKKVQLMTNAKRWQVVDGIEVLVDVPQEDIDPITDSSCVEIEGHRTLEETISQDNMFTPKIVETKVHSKVGGVYHDNVVDGAYEEAILYGNTQVNLVESVTTGAKYIPHSFTSFQSNESKIGSYNSGRTNQVAPLVKGVTMVNLCQETSATIPCQHTIAVANHNAKPNTEYTLKCKFTEKNKNAGIMVQSYGYKDGTWGYIEVSKTIQNLGDDVLLTFTTHEQADSIIIYNNLAFCADTNDSITLDDIMVIEGDVTDLNLPFFKGMRSVELSRPLTNLFTDDTTSSYPVANANGTVTVTSDSIGSWKSANFFLQDSLKPHTKYVVMWDSLTATQTSVGATIINTYDSINNTSLKTSDSDIISPTLGSYVFDTGNVNVNNITIRIHATTSNSETGTTTVKGLRVFEWDDSLRTLDLQTIGYFSGTKYVSAPRALETEGKNLYPYGDINFTNSYVGWCDAKGKTDMYGDIAQKSSTRFLLKKGTYTFSVGSTTNIDPIYLVDDKEQQVSNLSIECKTFTLTQDTYCTIRVKTIQANVATTVTNIQIERGETATTYEAYQSRYYKPRETEEIILKSLPNGVCDTFNLQTGELVQNIGEIVLDGSEDENWSHLAFSGASSTNGIADTYICYGLLLKDKARLTVNMAYGAERHVIDTLNISSVYGDTCNQADISTEMVCIHQNGRFYLRLRKDRFASTDLAGWKLWFSQNPITVQYELKEPIITKLQTYDRVYSGQTNAPTSMGNNLSALTYYNSNYYLKVGNLSPIPSIIEPITSIPYDVRLKPSTLYTVKYNRGGYSNSMKFDLGGSVVEKTNATTLSIVPEEFTVRTPAILSHEQIRLSGTGYAHNFIVVEGDITGTELPYFEGMKDVKMPIVKNISRNLLNESSMRVFYESNIVIRTYDVFPCKPNTRYCFVSVGGEISCNWHVCKKDAHYERPENESVGIIQYLGYSREIVTPQDCYYMCIHTGSNPTTDREVYDIKTAIYEGSFAECVNYGYEDYKENSVYAVQGEYPITSEMFEQGGFSTGNPTSDGSYETMKYGEENGNYLKRLRSKNLIPVKPNTTYAFAHSFSRFGYNIYQWNGNREFLQETSQYFASGQIETITTTADTQYIHFLMSKYNANENITVTEYDWSQFHMYELDSTINLRSLPNGVKDELNLLTGEYIQRVGEVVLDETESWNMDTTENAIQPNTNIFYTGVHSDFKPLATVDRAGSLVCDKVNVVPNLYFVDKVGIMSNTDPRIYVRVPKTDAPDVATFTTYIQNNPLTVQYELAEPIISHVRLVSNNQEREVGVKLPRGQVNTYNPSTGITTVRVGKMVLDGSENWYFDTTKTNTQVFGLQMSDMATTQNNLYCETMRVASGVDAEIIATAGGVLFIALLKTKASTVDELKTYLASNPITVWYELKYPQIQPDIVLPNGVHDEYNPETGVYTKRVGYVELDGSEHWVALSTAGYFYTEAHDVLRSSDYTKTMICDDLPIARTYASTVYGATLTAYPNNDLYPNENWIYIIGSSYTTKDELISSLSKNPIKVWYELAAPITYQLTPYFGLPQPYAYEDGYLIHDSAYAETTLPPEFKYKLVANRTGQVMQNSRKLQEHTTRLSDLEVLIIEATIESLFNRELQLFELELMDIQLIDLGE